MESKSEWLRWTKESFEGNHKKYYKQRAEWIADCLSIKFIDKDQIAALEEMWDKFKHPDKAESVASAPSSEAEEAVYWKHRCKLAERFIEESPGDPDTTIGQIKAYEEYKSFLAGSPIPTEPIRTDKVA